MRTISAQDYQEGTRKYSHGEARQKKLDHKKLAEEGDSNAIKWLKDRSLYSSQWTKWQEIAVGKSGVRDRDIRSSDGDVIDDGMPTQRNEEDTGHEGLQPRGNQRANPMTMVKTPHVAPIELGDSSDDSESDGPRIQKLASTSSDSALAPVSYSPTRDKSTISVNPNRDTWHKLLPESTEFEPISDIVKTSNKEPQSIHATHVAAKADNAEDSESNSQSSKLAKRKRGGSAENDEQETFLDDPEMLELKLEEVRLKQMQRLQQLRAAKREH